MLRRTVLTLLAALVLIASAGAEEKPKEIKKPLGTWVREVNNQTIKFIIKADDVTIAFDDGNGNSITITSAYGVTKDGVLFGTMTKVEKKGIDSGPDKGDLFSVAFTINDKEMTVSDLRGTHVNDDSRKLVEGVYSKK